MKVEDLLKPFPIKEFHPFPRAMMGPGAHEMVGPEALKMGFKKTLLMSSGLRGTDIVHNMAESLKWHGLEVVVYDKVESNPKDYNVMDAVSMYQQNACDSFVSIGGGSSHDACKGARISVAHDGRNVNEFEGFNKSENPKNPPHIAVSTTAGTGSETSWAYVITRVFLKPSFSASGPMSSCDPGPSSARGNGWNSLIGNGLSSSSTCIGASWWRWG